MNYIKNTAYWEVAKKHLSDCDETLGKIIASYHGEMLTSRGDAFYTLARSIVGQQISVKAADSVWRKLENCLVNVTPQNALNASEQNLRECGLSASKVRYLGTLADYFLHNGEYIKNWHNLPDEEVVKALTSIVGIGRWSAEMFMIFYLARPDIFPLADIGLQKAIFRHYNASEKLTKQEILEISEAWQPYRTVATWYLWRSLDPVPVAY